MQQEERAKMVPEKQAAVLLEQQQHMAKMGSLVPQPPLATRVAAPVGPPPPGVLTGAPGPRPRAPPPLPRGKNRETGDPNVGPKTPQALERILQLKEIRQEELISVHDESDIETDESSSLGVSISGPEEDTVSLFKKEKNRKRRNRKKKPQRSASSRAAAAAGNPGDGEKEALCPGAAEAPAATMDVAYVTENPETRKPNFIFLSRIFEAFKLTDDVEKHKEPEKLGKLENAAAPKKKDFEEEHEDSDYDSSDDEQKPTLSKKKMRRKNRLTVAELKQLVARPDLVEMHDVTAQDSELLVHLKATRNSVRVPRHWCFKHKYLQGKRGIEKPPLELLDSIKRPGIQEMREALQEKEEQQTTKSRMREKVSPKMGKIAVDYQKQHDAFSKWRSKPKLTLHGDLYHEGKEPELRISSAMRAGTNGHKAPPQWLIAMQRYGLPLSYPNLRIPGLNSPIPESCSLGYHVFGTNAAQSQTKTEGEEINRKLWGELEPSEEESDEEEEEEDDEDKADETGSIPPADRGLITPRGFVSVPAGMETPELLELRKKIGEAMDFGETPQLLTALPEIRTASLGSSHFYELFSVMSRKDPAAELQGVEAQGPEELELDPMAMTQKYKEHVQEQQAQKEDFSDTVAKHTAKQKQKKRKAQFQDSRGGSKKYKEFKF